METINQATKLKTIREALDKELQHQAEKHMSYYSSSEPDETDHSVFYDGKLELNALTLAVVKATLDAEAELQRQHDSSGIHGLVVSPTDEPNVLQITGPVDLKALAEAMKKAMGIDRPVFETKGKEQVYLYNCSRGQGSVRAHSLKEAQRRATVDAGWNDQVTNVRLATDGELTVRKAMGGDNA